MCFKGGAVSRDVPSHCLSATDTVRPSRGTTSPISGPLRPLQPVPRLYKPQDKRPLQAPPSKNRNRASPPHTLPHPAPTPLSSTPLSSSLPMPLQPGMHPHRPQHKHLGIASHRQAQREPSPFTTPSSRWCPPVRALNPQASARMPSPGISSQQTQCALSPQTTPPSYYPTQLWSPETSSDRAMSPQASPRALLPGITSQGQA